MSDRCTIPGCVSHGGVYPGVSLTVVYTRVLVPQGGVYLWVLVPQGGVYLRVLFPVWENVGYSTRFFGRMWAILPGSLGERCLLFTRFDKKDASFSPVLTRK